MIDPVNPHDKVVVVAVVTEEEDMLVHMMAHLMYAFLCQIIFKI